MTQKTFSLIENLKEAGQDHEFYPTTPEIIAALRRHMAEGESVLDIGAGRGDVLKGLQDKAGNLYAIEKSQLLIAELPKEVFIVGTDFHRQTLIDKKVDIIFSNPPFSEFEQWASKIIREANAENVFLVLPERWKESKEIKAALEARGTEARAVGSFSFLQAERAARGVVNLVKIHIEPVSYHNKDRESDPFRVWFEETFKASADKAREHVSEYASSQAKRERLAGLVLGRNVIERLEELYLEELETLIGTYRKLAEIPAELLQEIGVTGAAVCGSLKQKIEGLKNLYWQELFGNLDKITNRLTTASRKTLLQTLTSHTQIDFSSSNAYAVVIWAIKNANGYLDDQLTALYRELSNQESARAYKSNRHFIASSFRYNHRTGGDGSAPTRYKLDYRIVFSAWNCFADTWHGRTNGGLSERASDLINDLCTIGKNLGFDTMEQASSFDWRPGEEKEISFLTDSGDVEEFARIRCYKNGNIHFKINQKFMLKLNIEAARILGWINTPAQAADEMGEPLKACAEAFNSSFRITLDSVKLLETTKAA